MGTSPPSQSGTIPRPGRPSARFPLSQVPSRLQGRAPGRRQPQNAFKDEVIADLGTLGIWVYEQMTWTQISGADPDWVMAVALGDTPKEDLIADLGDKGLWKWAHNGYPGDWTQISG